jgi:hypothetical protein
VIKEILDCLAAMAIGSLPRGAVSYVSEGIQDASHCGRHETASISMLGNTMLNWK